MTYKLAKQLKDSGFPQFNEHDKKIAKEYGGLNSDYLKYPTLSELIEACQKRAGKGFELLCRGNKWDANVMGYGYDFFSIGDTAEGAVAKLWLALNRHHNL